MGQKVNPHGMRVGVIKDWDSRWYARDEKVGDLIVEDYKIRQYLKKTLYSAGIPNIEIERDSAKVRIYIHCSRPGVVIGKGGAEIARTECYHEGTIPLQTIRADIEYGFAEAATTYGRVGVKVWIYKGEILSQSLRTTPRTMDLNKRDDRRRDRRDGDRRGRGGYNRDRRDGNRQGGRPGYQGGGRPQGGNRPQGGFNRGPRPAAPAAPKEGGNN